ncbi:DUF6037 family protein [Brevibacillus borstelensis]|uniref:DUF6037 family protein n=1 Tax=Brevibacillus borstelensis TaxID=45462 RepID=UPI0002A50FC5|nr:DUF6037 family protein [Brevibacillus borstelensis]ELK43371.1 hypothetical protein D478_03639 [Brevibacillus agri BAB-2500]MED1850102.1 DUF6037 family protein [Brevibacillus borstelensis]
MVTLKLTGLKELYTDMKAKGIKRYKFAFTYNKVGFDIFFFTDEIPFKLMFGVKAHNFYFEVNVNNGFIIDTNIGDKYTQLRKILGVQYDPDNPFKTFYFFTEFNKRIPQFANVKNTPEPSDIASYRKDIEESDKIYFMGWRDNEKRGDKVSSENLYKTRLLLDYEAYLICKRKNISSRWTHDKSLAQKFHLPD